MLVIIYQSYQGSYGKMISIRCLYKNNIILLQLPEVSKWGCPPHISVLSFLNNKLACKWTIVCGGYNFIYWTPVMEILSSTFVNGTCLRSSQIWNSSSGVSAWIFCYTVVSTWIFCYIVVSTWIFYLHSCFNVNFLLRSCFNVNFLWHSCFNVNFLLNLIES